MENSISSDSNVAPSLKRALGLLAIAAFGVGDILGAGVYGLVGKIAGTVGSAAWLSYLAAGITAALTGLTYAEFVSRYPRAGGAAHFCHQVYRSPLVTFVVIFFVALSGLFSMATASRVFANYAMAPFPEAPAFVRQTAIPLAFIVAMAAVTARGIVISAVANAVCTVVEFFALLTIIAIGLPWLGKVNYLEFAPAYAAASDAAPLMLVLSGATIAFFAFIGFEDMANLAEETRNPERNIPLAICLAIVVTSAIYGLIALVAVSVVPGAELGASSAPLIDVVRKASPGFPVWVYSVVPLFAVFNTALLNLIMASRLFYGMAEGRGALLPGVLARVHPTWRTPIVSVGVGALVAIVLILSTQDLSRLAAGTTTFLLVVFLLLHVGLVKTKLARWHPASPVAPGAEPRFRVPIVVPILGALTCVALLLHQSRAALTVAGAMTLAILVLFAVNWFFLGRRAVKPAD